MLQRSICVSMLGFMIFILGGCWDYRPLETLSLAMGMGIDKDKDGYVITIQFVNPEEVAGKNPTERAESPIYQGRGPTIEEAINRISLNTPNYMYFANMQVVIIGEGLAKIGLKETLDYLYRFHDMRPDFTLVIAKHKKAADLFQVTSSLSKIPAEKIATIVRKMNQGKTLTIGSQLDFFNIMTHMISPYEGMVIGGFQIRGNINRGDTVHNLETLIPQARIYPTGLAVFKNDALQGWLTIPESIGYNYIMGTAQSVPESIMCTNKKKISARILDTKSNTKVYKKGHTIQAHIQLKSNLYITGVACEKRLSPKNLSQLEKDFAQQLEIKMRNTMNKAQKTFRLDIFGIGDTFSRSYPREWKKAEKKWKDIFPNIKVTYDVQVKTVHITNNIYHKNK
ncbi:Ger(x)C family spore germination protein [Bacillus tropicus]|uniref:Ger(x)C family spore germination protein n=1 Tax=Bacillus tropicus TaxID=2026188 RepID=UPI003D1962AC